MADTTQPAAATPRQTSSSTRLLYMSPMRPMIGFIAAPVMSVDVATHDTVAMLVPNVSGSTGSSGIDIVCMSATTATAQASEAVTATGCADERSAAGASGWAVAVVRVVPRSRG